MVRLGLTKYWGWSTEQTAEGKAARRAAVVKYANAICDLIDKYGYDGFDIDAEPNYTHPFSTQKELWEQDVENGVPTLMTLFIETLGKRIGPMAETEAGRKKILAVDGEPGCSSRFARQVLQLLHHPGLQQLCWLQQQPLPGYAQSL